MENATVIQPGTVALEPPSTVLNPETVSQTSGGGTPNLSEPKDDGNKPQSIEQVLEAENKRLKDADTEAEKSAKDKADDAAKDAKAKADEAAKAEKSDKKDEDKAAKARAEDGKFAKAEEPKAEKGVSEKTATERVASDDRQSEGRKHAEPPARFLPEAREKWLNVPAPIRAEVHRISQEYEAEIERTKASVERYEPIRQYDELAKSNGRELKDSLAKVHQIEQAIARNPIAGLEAVLREIGPRKADGSPLTLVEVAHHIVKNPEVYEQAMRPQMVQQPQPDQHVTKEIESLRAELQSMKAEQTIVPMITKFAEANPDYHALEPKIAEILGSGVIEKLYGNGLSPEQKLAEAYRMAGGTSPSRSDTPQALPQHSDAEPARPVNPDAGKKSVRGAPSDGVDTATDETETDLREMLRKEMRKLA